MNYDDSERGRKNKRDYVDPMPLSFDSVDRTRVMSYGSSNVQQGFLLHHFSL